MKESKIPVRVMYVDDNESHRTLFSEVIKQVAPGVEVIEIESGEKLMELLGTTKPLPDLIFLDLSMPEYGGLVCLRLIRRDAYLRDIPVIIYTGSTDQKDIEATWHNGADLYISKPMDLEDSRLIMKSIFSKVWSEHTSPPLQNYVLNVKGLN